MGSSANETIIKDVKEDISNDEEVEDLEWSADQEILLLYSLHGYKPVGPNKHFRMLLIQDRLSNAMNKNVSARAIWKKLNTLYDLEALDEAEAEADAAVSVETDFSLPEDEFGELIENKLTGHVKIEKVDADSENSNSQGTEMLTEIKTDPDTSSQDETEIRELDTLRVVKKEGAKRGPKKKDFTPMKESVPIKKEKDTPKKDIQKKETPKEPKKGLAKEDEKKDISKKVVLESKKDNKEEKKEVIPKGSKRDVEKKVEQSKRDFEAKKNEPKRAETPKNLRAEALKPRLETQKQQKCETSVKRNESKTTRTDTPKPLRSDTTPKQQRIDALKKEASSERRKETADKKSERKSPEKTPDSGRGAKLRAREKKDADSEKLETPTSSKRAKDTASDEPPMKKVKALVTKGRPTRNSIEPQQKPASPSPSMKRRNRVL